MDNARKEYVRTRIAHWDRASAAYGKPGRIGAAYHRMTARHLSFMIPKGLKVLELGCGHGDLLASLSPAVGLGVDFSGKMLEEAARRHPHLSFVQADAAGFSTSEKFDVIILSDLVNDLWDAQEVFIRLSSYCGPGTRIFINFYNNLWRIPLGIARRLGLGADVMEQNWFSPHDVMNLLSVSGFEVLKRTWGILLPFDIPLLSRLFNRWLVHFWPFSWLALTNFIAARPRSERRPVNRENPAPIVTVVVPARNEEGNIPNILPRIPQMGGGTEVIFVEGNSTDKTWAAIQKVVADNPNAMVSAYQQPGKGKGDAVRLGFSKAKGDVFMILDADLTMPPEYLPRFYDALVSGQGEFINGVRLVYPMEDGSMRFMNMLGNKFFSMAFTWLLGQPIKDTLCGTKVLNRGNYEAICRNRAYFGDFDPFGDFDLLFGAARLNLKIVEIPIRYRFRTYGETNIDRWRQGFALLKMAAFAASRLKFLKV